MSRIPSNFFRSAVVAAVVLPFCAPMLAQQVSTDYDHKADFSRYHTFSIYKVQASNTLVEGRLRDDITQSLQQKGWQQVPTGGDVAITAIGKVENEQQYNSFYDGLGGGYGYGGWGGRFGGGGWGGRGFGGGGFGGGGESTTTVQNIPVGNLVVDLYDTSTHQLVFRGMASAELSKNPDKNARKGEKAVDKIFNKLPNHAG